MNVSLPETLKDYVQRRVGHRAFSNPSDYMRTLVREDRELQAEARLGSPAPRGSELGRSDAARFGQVGEHLPGGEGADRGQAPPGMNRRIARFRQAHRDIVEAAVFLEEWTQMPRCAFSATGRRHFCRRCGSPVFGRDEVDLALGSFDEANRFTPSYEL
jgi:Arc/MetJ-type ribon-helix-helix transcriptional regulator